MDPLELATRVAAIPRRGAGTDAERRSATLLATELRGLSRRRRRTTKVHTVWVRPQRGLIAAGLATIAVLGSVVSVDHPTVGLVAAAVALVLWVGDVTGLLPLLRRLTASRATQDVVSRDARDARVRLVVTAATDTRRDGALDSGAFARWEERTRRRLRFHLPGPEGALALALVWLTGLLVARVLGAEGNTLGAVQLVPTAILIVAVALAVDTTVAEVPEVGAAEAAGVAVALGVVEALDQRPPRNLAVDCVLAGAGAQGFRAWVREQRRDGVHADEVAVLHVAPCAGGRPVWWEREGALVPLAYHRQLVTLARRIAREQPALGARRHETRSVSAGVVARRVSWPAIAIGSAPEGPSRDPLAIEAAALEDTIAFAVALVHALDDELDASAGRPVKRSRIQRAADRRRQARRAAEQVAATSDSPLGRAAAATRGAAEDPPTGRHARRAALAETPADVPAETPVTGRRARRAQSAESVTVAPDGSGRRARRGQASTEPAGAPARTPAAPTDVPAETPVTGRRARRARRDPPGEG